MEQRKEARIRRKKSIRIKSKKIGEKHEKRNTWPNVEKTQRFGKRDKSAKGAKTQLLKS